MQLEVVDRMETKSKAGLRGVFKRIAGEGAAAAEGVDGEPGSLATVPADPTLLRERLRNVGITLSERQVAAFLRPVLDRAGHGGPGEGFGSHGDAAPPAPQIDYRTFVELARPRGVPPAGWEGSGAGGGGGSSSRSVMSAGPTSPLRSPLPIGQTRRSSVDAGVKPLLGMSQGEGIGRFGVAPDARAEIATAMFPVTAADYVRKTNTSATGAVIAQLRQLHSQHTRCDSHAPPPLSTASSQVTAGMSWRWHQASCPRGLALGHAVGVEWCHRAPLPRRRLQRRGRRRDVRRCRPPLTRSGLACRWLASTPWSPHGSVGTTRSGCGRWLVTAWRPSSTQATAARRQRKPRIAPFTAASPAVDEHPWVASPWS